MTRVLIIAPTPMLRAGLRGLLAASPLLEVVADSATLTVLRNDETDVIVLADEAMLDDVVRRVPSDGTLALVVLSDNESVAATLRTLPLRGWAMLPTETSGAELQAAVSSTAQGLAVLSLAAASRLLGPRPTLEAPAEPLTPREREVLDLLGQGLSNKLIARELTISEHTVKFHVAAIFSKLGASSRADAVSRGARSGLITL